MVVSDEESLNIRGKLGSDGGGKEERVLPAVFVLRFDRAPFE
jgi:hypothetical protein